MDLSRRKIDNARVSLTENLFFGQDFPSRDAVFFQVVPKRRFDVRGEERERDFFSAFHVFERLHRPYLSFLVDFFA